MKENEVNLENKIREALPHLQKIENGQVFYSKYYGNITATKITHRGGEVYSIYGFCKEGLPRNNYYPKDLQLVGKPIMLNDVLYWFTTFMNNESEYTDEVLSEWDLQSSFLADQSEKLINYLNSIDYEREI